MTILHPVIFSSMPLCSLLRELPCAHWADTEDLYTLGDLLDVYSNVMVTRLQAIVAQYQDHTLGCDVCDLDIWGVSLVSRPGKCLRAVPPVGGGGKYYKKVDETQENPESNTD